MGEARLAASWILDAKVLVTSERARSGRDDVSWVFRQIRVGPLVDSRTWARPDPPRERVHQCVRTVREIRWSEHRNRRSRTRAPAGATR